MIRKTMFDDCKGEKLQQLLISFSTIVLRKVLATGHGGKASIAARLAIAKRITQKEHESFLPLAVAHRASLTALLRRKRNMRTRYRSFGQTLKSKEEELDQRFEAVVSNQNLLDQQAIPDHTVSRVSALFEKYWQGDNKIVNVIAQGEEQGLRDSLLDKPFEATWCEVSRGSFKAEIGTSRDGLMEDLERRIAEQQARLSQWKDFREAIKRDTKLRVPLNKQDLGLTRTTSNDQDLQKRKERDFVFSPRKSPRKSGWEIEHQANEMSPTPLKPAAIEEEKCSSPMLARKLDSAAQNTSSKGLEPQARFSASATSAHDGRLDYSDESGFSEISGGQLHYTESSDHAVKLSNLEDSSPSIRPNKVQAHEKRESVFKHAKKDFNRSSISGSKPCPVQQQGLNTEDNNLSSSDVSMNGEPEIKACSNSNSRDEDDILAEQIISMTINAAPTPAKPKLSLAERTRQSMAFATPSGFQGLTAREASPPSTPSIAAKNESRYTDNGSTNTLLERTRQSISMLPPKPKASRKSIHNRRESKIYPTNQFETPKKQLSMVEEATPPEVLFSPGAEYDSVFKSRPKIAVSPTPSPMPGHRSKMNDTHEDESAGDGIGRVQSSPLARITARV